MSDDIKIEFEVRNMTIMRKTLEEMDIHFNSLSDDVVEIPRDYHNIVINGNTGEISFDTMNKNEVDIITQKYQVAWYKDNLIRQGNKVKEEVKQTGEIVLRVTR